MEILHLAVVILFAVNLFLIYLLVALVRREKLMKKEAIKKSRLVLEGKFKEQLAPFLPDFDYNPTDARFLGSPIDFIVFDGSADENIKKIVFLEIKTGKSRMTKREEQIKEAVKHKKVEFRELRF